ncbi:uncharacterized protein METZ01_LOCUS128767, partial [marine metagenome]
LEAADERISGQGDGRISEKDAEEIVELSKDGGRITETELITLQYISENYHFTPKAAAWFAGKLPDIERAVDPEQFEQAKKSYYKTIQGVRYDRALLEAADERISGQGDGRISEKDAEEIVELSKDGGRITETELITLQYISENYHFTPKAAAWFAGKLPDIERAVDPEQFEQA